MTNDRKITISAAGSRTATDWLPQVLLLSELYERLRVPTRSPETQVQYMALKKGQQDALKDVGGFVAGSLNGGRRKASTVTGRDVVTLDLDNIEPGKTAEVLRRIDGLGCGYCIYSTRKHSPAGPRLRVLLPLDRTVTADEYEPIARKAAEMVGIGMADPTTFEPSRLMYWPSCCADGEYIYQTADRPLVSATGMLGLYADWRDMTSWPQVPGEVGRERRGSKQADPTSKSGVVGAFCRTYNIYSAIETFLPGVYSPVDGQADRYTYTGGSTTGGAVVYDEGSFLFSHHATDPAGGLLVNSFDLCRLHLFGDLDDDAKPGTPTNRLPSFAAMADRALEDKEVAVEVNRARAQSAAADFDGLVGEAAEEDDWMSGIDVDKKGDAVKTINNALYILEHDPAIKGRIATDDFAHRGVVLDTLPWDPLRAGRRPWTDEDETGARWYLETRYNLTGREKITDALTLCGRRHAFDDLTAYISGLEWDGVPRLDTLFIDYLGAADTPYIRAVTRKAFCGAVARALCPGAKFDYMTILAGPQGIGKSTLLSKMARGWFTDSLKTFKGKDAPELIQGVWIVEIGELSAMKQTEVEEVKQFLSQTTDRFRAAYGRNAQTYPRRCVFFGTSNQSAYLRDRTGGRRFWPVDVGTQDPRKSVFGDLDGEVDQIWAEASARYAAGEALYLDGEAATAAQQEQEAHRETSPWEGIIEDFLARPVPEDWDEWDPLRRSIYWGGGAKIKGRLVPRRKVCAVEVWVEALGGDRKNLRKSDSAEINSILAALPGWGRSAIAKYFGPYGKQRGFEIFGECSI